jgi:hypothetical protein
MILFLSGNVVDFDGAPVPIKDNLKLLGDAVTIEDCFRGK